MPFLEEVTSGRMLIAVLKNDERSRIQGAGVVGAMSFQAFLTLGLRHSILHHLREDFQVLLVENKIGSPF